MSLPSTWAQNDSCLAFCSGVRGKVVWCVVDDAQPLEPLEGFSRRHRRAVVCQQRPWQSSFEHGLAQAVHERLGGLIEIPLQVAA